MIRFVITSIARRSSSEVGTIRYSYTEKDGEETQEPTRTAGAEWEEVEFSVEREEKPTIQIANVVGNALLTGNPKLIVNNPELFGTYKVGDVIEFMPIRITELQKTSN